MTYKEALGLKNNRINLIGQVDEKGFIIGELLILPSDNQLRTKFFQAYLTYRNPELALKPYLNQDLEVWAIDIKHLDEANVLFFKKIN